MTLAIVYSRASAGIRSPLITVEAHMSYGMSGFCIVGLPEKAVRESKDRIRSAFMNSNLDFPSRRITINLAPADLPKEGGRFDLPIALGILAATGQIPLRVLSEYEFAGELALSGELRAIHGALPVVLGCHQSGRKLILPEKNKMEASLVKHASVLTAPHLLAVCAHLRGQEQLAYCAVDVKPYQRQGENDLADVKGQQHAKRALEIAAAGRHSLLFVGPPGTGKTMLASRLTGLLPDITDDEALDVAAITSVSSGGFDPVAWRKIPFRAPHHSSSAAALVGGGRPPQPGEISLAHHGVLFLDELPEFSRHVLDTLREPLESGQVTISRAAVQSIFPARFQLIAAMNPCPCGYAGSQLEACRCTSEQIARYMNKLSGPFLDRLDMQIEVPRLPPEILMAADTRAREATDVVRERVLRARAYQYERQSRPNSELSVSMLEELANIDKEAESMLRQLMEKFNLSARAYHRIIKVARTIADMAVSQKILVEHVSEALCYRSLDRLKTKIFN